MEYRRLGRSGLQVSQLSFGSWVTYHNQVNVAAARDMMAAAYDAGGSGYGVGRRQDASTPLAHRS